MVESAPTLKVQQRYVPTLHHLAHSSSHRVLWALEELKEVHGETFKYKLKTYPRIYGPSAELKAIFPLGKSPIVTLEPTDNPDSEAKTEALPLIQIQPGLLAESRLILRYLRDEYGGEMWLPDSENGDKGRDEYFEAFSGESLNTAVSIPVILELLPTVLPFPLSTLLGLLFRPIAGFWKTKTLPDMFQLLENALCDDKRWFAGDAMGLSDFNLSFPLDQAFQRGYVSADKFPKLSEWHERILARGAYQRALGKGNGYDLVTFGA